VHKLTRSKLGFIRITIAAALIFLATSTFWSYRVRAAGEEAAQFEPADTSSILLPAGTVVPGAIRSGVVSSAQAGDTVRAFVSTRVSAGEKVAFATETQLKGEIEDLTILGNSAKVSMEFTNLLLPGRTFTVQTQPVVAVIPIRSDAEIVSNTFRMLIGASIGAAIGAASENNQLIPSGLIEGARPTASVEQEVPIAVILVRDVNLLP